MDDIAEQAEAIFIIGSNTTEQHPVFGTKLRQSVRRRGVKLVVADPRKIDITDFAALHIRQRPGTDAALLNGIMRWIIEHDRHDGGFIANRCEDFESFADAVDKYTLELTAEITGVLATDIARAADLLSASKPMAVIWAMGITQHTTGVLNVLSLANLQMLLGNMGIPGGGVNPLRGQNNVQGACDMGALPNVFPGYQPVADSSAHAKFADTWALRGVGLQPAISRSRTRESSGREDSSRENSLGSLTTSATAGKLKACPTTPGLTVTEMVEGAGRGDVRALYILGEDPAMSEPDSNHARECLERAEFIVLQEILVSETAHYADVLLPGASFAEKHGTFTNTERRVQLVRQAIPPIGAAKPDWEITSMLAKRVMEHEKRRPLGEHAGWDYADASDVADEIAQLTPSYAGVDHKRLADGERLQWPVPSAEHPGTPLLHVGKFTRGKGKFHAVDHIDAKELPDDEYPLLLTTGRVLYHWHGGELTRRDAGLSSIHDRSLVEISPEDARRLGVEDGAEIQLCSRRGEMEAAAAVTDRVPTGVVFGTFHFPGNANVNNLTISALDPVAKIPEYKVCAVKVEAM